MLSVIAAQNRNSPAQVVPKCARRLTDGTQCFHCDRLENVMSLQRGILGFLARGGHLSHRARALNCQINVRVCRRTNNCHVPGQRSAIRIWNEGKTVRSLTILAYQDWTIIIIFLRPLLLLLGNMRFNNSFIMMKTIVTHVQSFSDVTFFLDCILNILRDCRKLIVLPVYSASE